MTSEHVRNTENRARTGSIRKAFASPRVSAVTLSGLVVASVAGLGYVFLGGDKLGEGKDHSRTVAIVNADVGATVDGQSVRASDKLIEQLEAEDSFDWTVVDTGAASSDKYFATVTVPEDFSEAVSSVWGTNPRQATLAVDIEGSDPAASEELSGLVSSRISADGITALLADMSSSRATFQQAGFAAGFLAAGTSAADSAVQQLMEGADTLLPYLDSARSGAVELQQVADQIEGVVGETSGNVDDLAGRLTGLGLTLGQANASATAMQASVDDAIHLLNATPLAPTVVPSLQQVSDDLGLLSSQLGSVPGLLGGQVGPETDLGELVRVAMAELADVSGQLSSAAQQLNDGIVPIADEAPELLDGATAQIVDGFESLKTLSGQVSTDLNDGVAAIPARSSAQQAQLATVLAEPVAVTRTYSAPTSILTAEHLAIGFGITTILLAGAVAWMSRRTPDRQRAS
ncbi:hypothetical protein BFN03_17345 [Rhodococcus sp. WMMA185]|uniref:YhgE/Pip domain-containing protein n=1 Tax=Rhodococcus sp. WMMA185 TaxID=679318 RepID=UPI000878B7FB|nr:hypothetical protein [Rhodococcus sp. WMMA185]AOW93823.1 hypothetical protein BFN03_17345 [Rhodococcus sp. WMMA185]